MVAHHLQIPAERYVREGFFQFLHLVLRNQGGKHINLLQVRKLPEEGDKLIVIRDDLFAHVDLSGFRVKGNSAVGNRVRCGSGAQKEQEKAEQAGSDSFQRKSSFPFNMVLQQF